MEVIKAKTAVVHGTLSSLLSMSRAFFVGYNRDSQWTKYLIMDLIHECIDAPTIMAAVLDTLTVNEERAAALCEEGFVTATDLMESLISDYGLSMREGKILVERAVKYSDEQGSQVVTADGLQKAVTELDLKIDMSASSVADRQDPVKIISRRKAAGGPAPETLLASVSALADHMKEHQAWLQDESSRLQAAKAELERMEADLLQGKQ